MERPHQKRFELNPHLCQCLGYVFSHIRRLSPTSTSETKENTTHLFNKVVLEKVGDMRSSIGRTKQLCKCNPTNVDLLKMENDIMDRGGVIFAKDG